MACRPKSTAAKYHFSFAKPPLTSFEQTSVLVRAINAENLRQVKLLLERSSDPNKAVGELQIRPLMHACYVKDNCRRMAIFKSLLHYEADPTLTDAAGQSSLMYACALNLNDEMELLLKNTIYTCFGSTDLRGNTLLHVSAMSGNTTILDIAIKTMLLYRMDLNIRNKSKQTALDMATLYRKADCAELLSKAQGYSFIKPKKISKPKSSLRPKLSRVSSAIVERHKINGECAAPLLDHGAECSASTYLRPSKKELPMDTEEKMSSTLTGLQINSTEKPDQTAPRSNENKSPARLKIIQE